MKFSRSRMLLFSAAFAVTSGTAWSEAEYTLTISSWDTTHAWRQHEDVADTRPDDGGSHERCRFRRTEAGSRPATGANRSRSGRCS